MIQKGRYLTGRAFQMLAAEVRGLQRAVYILALFALLSSLLALLRDRLFAHLFGAGTTLDLYYAAFRIPDFLFVIMGALVSVYILIPELTRRTKKEQRDYIDTIVVGFSALAIVVCALAAAFAPYVLDMLFPQFVESGLLPSLTALSRVLLLQPILLGFSNIFGAITQSRHRYVLYAISPLFYNLGIIAGAAVLYPIMGILGLAWGVVGGAFLHASIQIPSILNDGFFHRIPRLGNVRTLLTTMRISVPRALALSMSQLAFIALIALAGLLSAGSIATFMFAYNLQAVPLSIIGASYSVAAFPGLAAALAMGERARFIQYVATAARYVVFWSLPATALIIVLRAHIVRVILGSGSFNWTDTRLTAAAFALFILALVAQSMMLLIVRAYYAAGRTFTPFIISTGVALATVLLGAASVGALNITVVRVVAEGLLRVVDVPGSDVLALAFAYAFAAILGTAVLVAHFEYRFRGFLGQVYLSWLQALFSAIGAGIAAYAVLHVVGPITLSSTLLTVFIRGSSAGIAGLGVAAALYAILGNREFEETMTAIKNRIPGYGKRAAATLRPDVVAAAEEQVVP